jgi:hypothetical protein
MKGIEVLDLRITKDNKAIEYAAAMAGPRRSLNRSGQPK